LERLLVSDEEQAASPRSNRALRVRFLRAQSLQDYAASLVTAPGAISLSMFLLFAALPILVALFTRDRVGAIS
jgi:hypothetical protein